MPDDDPGLAAPDAAGCFTGGTFDPGPVGWDIVRDWPLADEASAGPEDLIAQLAHAAGRIGPDAHLVDLGWPEPLPSAAAISIPRPPGPATEPAVNH